MPTAQLLVAVGDTSSSLFTAPTPAGSTYTARSVASGKWERPATDGLGTYVATNDYPDVMVSTDNGATWATTAGPPFVFWLEGEFHGYVQVNANTVTRLHSTDGSSWTTESTTGHPGAYVPVAVVKLGDTYLLCTTTTGSGGQLYSDFIYRAADLDGNWYSTTEALTFPGVAPLLGNSVARYLHFPLVAAPGNDLVLGFADADSNPCWLADPDAAWTAGTGTATGRVLHASWVGDRWVGVGQFMHTDFTKRFHWAESADGKAWTHHHESTLGQWKGYDTMWDGTNLWAAAVPTTTGVTDGAVFKFDTGTDTWSRIDHPATTTGVVGITGWPQPSVFQPRVNALHGHGHIAAARVPLVAGALHGVGHIGAGTPAYKVSANALHGVGHIGAAGPNVTQTINVASFVSGAVMSGPHISQSDVTPDAFTARLLDRDNLTGTGTILTGTYSEQWVDQMDDAGSGRLTLDNDDAQLALVDDNSLVRFEVQGAAALTFIVRERDHVAVAEQEEYAEATMLSGPGHLAILDEAVVYPSRGTGAKPIEDERAFNWAAVAYDDSGWGNALELARQSTGAPDWLDDQGNPWPTDWPDGNAWWIGPTVGTSTDAPSGDNYFRSTFTVDTGCVTIFAAADNLGDVWIDGQKVMDLDTFTETMSLVLDVSNGEHTIAAHIWNAPDDLAPGDNPTGFICSVYPTNGATRKVTVTAGAPLVRTDASWKLCEYPPYPPGMTPGEILTVLMDEASTRDATSLIAGLQLQFDGETDSDGVAWTEVTDYSTRVGNDYLTVLKELAESYIDFEMAPGGLELRAWVRGGRGAASGVSFHEPTDVADPATGNLAVLSHKRVI